MDKKQARAEYQAEMDRLIKAYPRATTAELAAMLARTPAYYAMTGQPAPISVTLPTGTPRREPLDSRGRPSKPSPWARWVPDVLGGRWVHLAPDYDEAEQLQRGQIPADEMTFAEYRARRRRDTPRPAAFDFDGPEAA